MPVEISYDGFCALGALTNPRLFTRAVYLGKHYVFHTYWYLA